MKNYRPVSLLPIISKVFERIMYNQMFLYINNHLSPYIFGYRKGHSTEQCLMVMMEMWKKALDEKKQPGAILTDLSKAFDTLKKDLMSRWDHSGSNELEARESIWLAMRLLDKLYLHIQKNHYLQI